MLGASFGRRFSAGNGTSFDSWSVGPAMLVLGFGGNGSTEPSLAVAVGFCASAGNGAVIHRPSAMIDAEDNALTDFMMLSA